jgi:hypothetical protein
MVLTGYERSILPSLLISARAGSPRPGLEAVPPSQGDRLLPRRPEEEVPEEPDRVGEITLPVLVRVARALEAALALPSSGIQSELLSSLCLGDSDNFVLTSRPCRTSFSWTCFRRDANHGAKRCDPTPQVGSRPRRGGLPGDRRAAFTDGLWHRPAHPRGSSPGRGCDAGMLPQSIPVSGSREGLTLRMATWRPIGPRLGVSP